MNIELVADGITWSGWQSLNLKKSLSQVQHSFDMTTTDRYQAGLDQWNVKGGAYIEVMLDGARIFDGYVQDYNTSLASGSHNISIKGESRAIDLVQCSHIGNYFWKNTSAESVISELVEPYGFTVIVDVPLLPIPKEGLRMAVDSSPYDLIKKIAEQNGLLVFTDDAGNIRLSKDIPQFEFTELTTGDYTQISATHNVASTFSKVIIKAQEKTYKKGEFKEKQQKEFIANNERLVRYRPKIIISDGKDKEQENLTKYVNRRLNGNGVKANLTVKSPYDKNGNLWAIGQRIWLNEPRIDVDQELIISDLTFSISDSAGFEAKMELQVPETFSITDMSRVTARRSTGLFEALMGVFA